MKSGQSRIELAQELKDQLSQMGDKRIERIPAAINGVNALTAAFPDQYHWRFKTAEASHVMAMGQRGALLDDPCLFPLGQLGIDFRGVLGFFDRMHC